MNSVRKISTVFNLENKRITNKYNIKTFRKHKEIHNA
jgi:hypothetical protein